MKNNPILVAYAQRLYDAGIIALPTRMDGSKAPLLPWQPLAQNRPSAAKVASWFVHMDTDGIGFLTGAISGELEMLEFEGRAVTEGYVQRFVDLLTENGLGEVWERIIKGWLEMTPTGGLHAQFRVIDGPALRNQKLASRPATAEELALKPLELVKVLMETRADGGYVVGAPSAGDTHPTGLPWVFVVGGPDTVAGITSMERDMLYAVASTLNQLPEIATASGQPHTKTVSADGELAPGEDYNQRASWPEILEPLGWTQKQARGFVAWTRPGKTDAGISATTGKNEADNLYVFSSSTEFQQEVPYSKFAAITMLNHGGDFSAAAGALRKAGYGGSQGPPLTYTGPPALSVVPDLPIDPNAPPEPAAVNPAHFGATERGMALALIKEASSELHYCPQRGMWMVWSDGRWVWDESEQVYQVVLRLAEKLPKTDDWRTFKKRALSAAGVAGIVRLARSDTDIVVHLNDLDARPFELNTPGGIVDLRTGELRPPDPSALHTRTTNVTPDFDMPTPVFDKFLADTFGEGEVAGYVQRGFGVSIIGKVLEQVLFFAHGSGANGKSTLIELMLHVLRKGDEGYALSAPAEMLTARTNAGHPTELAQLAGVRLVVCSELEKNQKFAQARVKLLTGGDTINARFLYKNPFTFAPAFTLWLLANDKPVAAAGGDAFWRRPKLIEFANVRPDTAEGRDKDLPAKLAAEGPGVLAWAIRGTVEYLRAGMQEPAVITDATKGYEGEQDTVGQFLRDPEECLIGGGKTVRIVAAKFIEAYNRFCYANGDEPLSLKEMVAELGRHGIGKGKSGSVRYYYNISLVQPEGSNSPLGYVG